MLISTDTGKIEIPSSQIVSGHCPAAFMRERTAAMYDMTPLRASSGPGRHVTTNWYVGRVLFIRTEHSATVIRRSKAQAENGAGLVFLHRYVGGRLRGLMGDLNIDRDPGEMYLIDQAQRVDCIQFQTKIEGVFIPKDLIGFDPDRHAPFMRFSHNKTLSALLYRAVLEIADSAGTRGAVSAAADRWGFSSSANFNRAVREKFDVSPGMLVQLPQRDLRYLGVAKQVDEFAQRA